MQETEKRPLLYFKYTVIRSDLKKVKQKKTEVQCKFQVGKSIKTDKIKRDQSTEQTKNVKQLPYY